MTYEPTLLVTSGVGVDTIKAASDKINTNLEAIANGIIEAIDGRDWQDSCIDKDATAPPVSPTEGDRYIVASPATSGWLGHELDVAEYRDDAWLFVTPNEGYCCRLEDENLNYVYNGSAWVTEASNANHNSLSGLNGGASNDYQHLTTAQLAVVTGATATPATSKVPIADGSGKLDGWISNIGSTIDAATAKTAPVDADYLALSDSETTPTAGLLKKLSWSYVKSVLKTYFDGVYTLANLGGVATSVTVAGHALTGNVAVSASDVGLGNVVNVAQAVKALDFSQATSSPALLLDPPDNAVLSKIVIVVDTTASAGAPTCSVGISGDTDRDMDELDCSLLVAGTYIVEPYTACGTSGANISLTITPDSQTFAGRCYLHYVVPE